MGGGGLALSHWTRQGVVTGKGVPKQQIRLNVERLPSGNNSKSAILKDLGK